MKNPRQPRRAIYRPAAAGWQKWEQGEGPAARQQVHAGPERDGEERDEEHERPLWKKRIGVRGSRGFLRVVLRGKRVHQSVNIPSTNGCAF